MAVMFITSPAEQVPYINIAGAPLFTGEEDLFGQHGGDTGNLFLRVHFCVGRVGLEFVGHNLIDTCHHGEEVHCLAIFHQDLRQRLYKPGAIGRVSPGIITCKQAMLQTVSV